jgi:hypothetical protein
MRSALRLLSYLGLALSVVPPLLVWAGRLSMETNLQLLTVGMFVWFGSAIFWIKPEKHDA